MSLDLNQPTDCRVTMPPLLSSAIAAMTEEQAAIARALWAAEPALRSLMLLLDSMNPERYKPPCPACGNTRVHWSPTTPIPTGTCKACNRWFSAAAGTPFANIRATGYRKLYAALLTLWGPWTPFHVPKVAGCCDSKQFGELRRRLQPLFDELLPDDPLVSAPAYRLGFTPAQQGLRCLRCGSDHLVFSKRADWLNPTMRCLGCQYHFRLHAANRKLLPLPPGAACPDCGSKALIRRFNNEDGRQVYACRDCFRQFIENNKRPDVSYRQRADRGKLNHR